MLRFLLVPVLLSGITPLSAAEIEKVKFAEILRINGREMRLNNVGLMRYKVVIKAMVAGLYLEQGVATKDTFNDVAKRLEIEYFWALKGSDIAKAADDLLARNVSAATRERLRPQTTQMYRLFEDVKPGDRYSLTYIPGVGTELALNGVSKGVVEGPEFAAAFFTIWLGTKPMDVSLRDQLFKTR